MLWSIFFQTHIPIQLSHFSPFTPLDEDTKLNCQKTLDLEVVDNWLTGKSLPVTKTSIFTASPFLLENYRTFPNLHIDEKTIMLLQKIWKYFSKNLFFRASHCKIFWSWSWFYITPIQSRMATIHKMPSLSIKCDPKRFVFSMNSFPLFLMNFMLIWSLSMVYSMKMLNFSRRNNTKHCFDKLKKPITNDVHLTLLNTNIPIYFHCSFFPNR